MIPMPASLYLAFGFIAIIVSAGYFSIERFNQGKDAEAILAELENGTYQDYPVKLPNGSSARITPSLEVPDAVTVSVFFTDKSNCIIEMVHLIQVSKKRSNYVIESVLKPEVREVDLQPMNFDDRFSLAESYRMIEKICEMHDSMSTPIVVRFIWVNRNPAA